MKHVHAEAIIAWANGETIEAQASSCGIWFTVEEPSWDATNAYRVKPTPKPNIVHEVVIHLSECAGPLIYAVEPGKGNCFLFFDGDSGKLKGSVFKGT